MMELLLHMDRGVTAWFVSQRTEGLTWFLQLITYLGSPTLILILAIITLGFLAFRQHCPDFKMLFFTIGGGELLNESLKWLIRRGRPPLPWLTTALGYSFPSGHSLMSTIFYGILAYLFYRNHPRSSRRAPIVAGLVTIPFIVGISRIYLGVHFLTDVLGGWLIGVFWIGYSLFIFKRAAEEDRPE